MGRRIVALALTGWSGIIALAWWLADRRIEICGDRMYNRDCIIEAAAARDTVLIAGLSVALAVLIVAALVGARRAERLVPKNLSDGSRRLPAE